MTYLMWKRGSASASERPARTRTGEISRSPGPAMRMNQEHADAVWVLSTHATEAEARKAEMLTLATPSACRRCRSSLARTRRAHGRSLVGESGDARRDLRRARHGGGWTRSARRRGAQLRPSSLQAATTTSGSRRSAKADRVALRDLAGGGRSTGSRCSATTTKGVVRSRAWVLASAGVPRLGGLALRVVVRRLRAARRARSRTSRTSSTSPCASRPAWRPSGRARARTGTRCRSCRRRPSARAW